MALSTEIFLTAACFAAVCVAASMGQVFSSDSGGGISCYVCSSINGSNPACHDPFDSSLIGLTTPCSQGRRNQRGVFPARFCFKLKGVRRSDGQPVLVRRCSVDPLVNNVMKSHCGHFKIAHGGELQYFDGCVSMCRFDGCNSANPTATSATLPTVLTSATLALLRLKALS